MTMFPPVETGCCDGCCDGIMGACSSEQPKSKSLSINLSQLDMDIESLISTTKEYTGQHDGTYWNIKKKTKSLSTVVVHWCDPRTNKLRETVAIVQGGSRATIEQLVSRAQEGRFRTNTKFELPGNALGGSQILKSMAASFFGATGDAMTNVAKQDYDYTQSMCAGVVFTFVLVMVLWSTGVIHF